jgi:hypothetical protein
MVITKRGSNADIISRFQVRTAPRDNDIPRPSMMTLWASHRYSSMFLLSFELDRYELEHYYDVQVSDWFELVSCRVPDHEMLA